MKVGYNFIYHIKLYHTTCLIPYISRFDVTHIFLLDGLRSDPPYRAVANLFMDPLSKRTMLDNPEMTIASPAHATKGDMGPDSAVM